MTAAATVEQFTNACAAVRERETFTPAEEALADAALLALSKLREALVVRDANSLACRVDEHMEAFHFLARKAMP